FAEAGDVPRFHPELGQHLAEFLDRGRVLQVVPDRVLRFLGVQQRERGTALRTGRVDPDLHVLGSLCPANASRRAPSIRSPRRAGYASRRGHDGGHGKPPRRSPRRADTAARYSLAGSLRGPSGEIKSQSAPSPAPAASVSCPFPAAFPLGGSAVSGSVGGVVEIGRAHV